MFIYRHAKFVLKCNILLWLWHGSFKWLENVCNKQTGMWHDFNTCVSEVIGKLSSMASQVGKSRVFGSSGWVNGSSFKPGYRGVTLSEMSRDVTCEASISLSKKCTTNLPFQSRSLATPAAKKHTGPKCEATAAAAAAAAIWFQHSHSNIWMQKGCCGPPGPENRVPYWTTCESPDAKTAQRPKWAG